MDTTPPGPWLGSGHHSAALRGLGAAKGGAPGFVASSWPGMDLIHKALLGWLGWGTHATHPTATSAPPLQYGTRWGV